MPIFPVLVMPARDEAVVLAGSCASIGYGREGGPTNCRLVVIDNGSRDATAMVAQAILERSPQGTMEILHEAELGHAPARHAGTMAAWRWAATHAIDPVDVLVLQADADTAYRPGYVESMVQAAERAGPGYLVEGCSVPPDGTADLCAAFRALEAAVDATTDGLVGLDDPHDVVVDDKVAAFRLSDYLAWGGHVREYDRDGDEILAETTRLYMRAVRCGARRTRAVSAEAVTSQRRILEDPATAFATAGFPRSRRWIDHWQDAYRGPTDLAAFVPGMQDHLREAVQVRAVHMRALFSLLPAYVRSLENSDVLAANGALRALADAGLHGVAVSPGEAISRLLELARDG